MMKPILFTPLVALLLSAPAFGSGEGTAVGVNPDAAARLATTERILEVGADVSVGELIVTGPSGQVQIVFDDETRLVVGPRSSLKIETYLMANSNTAQKLAIDALGGSFRFITGNSPKPAYSINTPTAAIAVRGTEFDIIVEPRLTKVMLYEGALKICNSGSDCEDVTRKCEVGTSSSEEVGLYVRNDPQRLPLSLEFRYARFQAPLLPQFRVGAAVLCTEETVVRQPTSNDGSGGTVTTPDPGQGPAAAPVVQPAPPRPAPVPGKN